MDGFDLKCIQVLKVDGILACLVVWQHGNNVESFPSKSHPDLKSLLQGSALVLNESSGFIICFYFQWLLVLYLPFFMEFLSRFSFFSSRSRAWSGCHARPQASNPLTEVRELCPRPDLTGRGQVVTWATSSSSKQPWWSRWWLWSRRREFSFIWWSSRKFSSCGNRDSSTTTYWRSRYAACTRHTDIHVSSDHQRQNATT